MTVTDEQKSLIARWEAERAERERALREAIVERNLAMIGRREDPGNRGLERQDLVPEGGDGNMWCALYAEHNLTRAMGSALGLGTTQPGENTNGKSRIDIHHYGRDTDSASMGKWRSHGRAAGAFVPHRRGQAPEMEPGDIVLLTRSGADPEKGHGHVTTFLRKEERNGVMGYLCVGANVRNGVNFEWIPENSSRWIGHVDTGKMLEKAEKDWLERNPGQVAQYAASRSFGDASRQLAEPGTAQPSAGTAVATNTRPMLVDDNPRLLGVPAAWVQGRPPEDVARIKAAYDEVRHDLTYELGAGPLHISEDRLKGVDMEVLRSVVYDDGTRGAPSQTVGHNLPVIRIENLDTQSPSPPVAPYVPPARTLVATADGGFAVPRPGRS